MTLLSEMEMRSLHASYVSPFLDTKKSPNVWLPWSWNINNKEPILFCLRVVYGWDTAQYDDLYERPQEAVWE